jgi:predicted flap endonuclease-1-like 5' DNA nuclease
VTLPEDITTRVITNSVRVTGKAPDGRTVSAQASHNLPVSRQEAVLTDIPGITAANAEKLKSAGIETVEELAKTPVEKLQEIFPRISAEKLREWINEAKKLME